MSMINRTALMARATPRLVVCSLLLLMLSLACVATAHANLTFERVGLGLTGPDGKFSRQAGAHPDFSVAIDFRLDPNAVIDGRVSTGPSEAVHAVEVDLPDGFVGNPEAAETCDPIGLANPGVGSASCPVGAQIGVVDVTVSNILGPLTFKVGLYNIAHGPDVPARFGFNYEGAVATIDARVRPGDYGISSGSFAISQAFAIESIKLKLWGVPADPSHDTSRESGGFIDPNVPVPSQSPRVPFFSSPTSCTDAPAPFTIRGDSWEHRGAFDTRTLTTDDTGTPFVFDGCERLPFDPAIDVKPLSRVADAPTGLNVDLTVPQTNDPDGLATANVRRVVMTLPKGMSVSPSSAAGLGACAPAQIGLGTNGAPRCPDSAKLGKVTIDTPLLPDPLVGDMILATQNDNPFRSLIALYMVAKGPGFYLKLPGKIDLDPATGQLVATFDNTPQLPFSRLQVAFQGGSSAPLATPTSCGTYNTHVEITSWASSAPVALDSPMAIDEGCTPPAFAPSFTAGTTNPLAGQNSPFVFTLTRSDRMPYLSGINATLPPGLLARIGSVTQCGAGAAATGACPADSRIGSTAVLSGPGGQPLALSGNVYLTGPYNNPATGQHAPFGLSIAVPTAGQAGPFDLGVVVVRAGIYVDRKANVTVKSDPLPTVIQGIPLRLRQVVVKIDRPKFMFNPTDCSASNVLGTFTALGGAVSQQAVPFRPGGCGDLELGQKIALRFTGKKSTTDGTHPGVRATLTDPGGGSNLDKVQVKLPISMALDPDNAQALCKPLQRLALNCPKASIVGTATAMSILPHPLTGPVYFVEGLRKTRTGRTVTTLPKLWIPLSGDGVTIDVDADSSVDSIQRLVTTFHDIPDAPITSFKLQINGGKHGILVVSGKPGACDRDKTINGRFTGQNGEIKTWKTQAKFDGCKPTVKKIKTSSKAVTLQVANLDSGQLTLSGGALLKKSTRTLNGAPQASITAKLTRKAQAALRHAGKLKLSVSVGFRPPGGKAVTVKRVVVVRR
jgi:hypothetical protein